MSKKIPTLIGIVLLILGVAVGVVVVQQETIFRLGASPEIAPQDVRVTNVTDTSFTVSWTTQKATIGILNYGQGGSSNEVARDENLTSQNLHHVSVRALTPQTQYSFKISSDGKEFDNNGSLWIVQTGPALNTQPNTLLVSGVINSSQGLPLANTMVFVSGRSFSPLSTKTDNTGQWVIPLANARSAGGTGAAQFGQGIELEIFVQGGPNGIATAKINSNNASPLPPITLGQVFDFRTTATVTPDTEKKSGFNFEGAITNQETQVVTLDSIKDGETIFTQVPELFGEGPINTEITITVESSHTQVQTISVGANGLWSWAVPNALEEGNHTITISWTDANGLLRQLTRSFTVLAQSDEPSFVSTPSGGTQTSSPSPSPSPSASPSQSPTPSATPLASPSPSLTPSASPTALPDAGIALPTITAVAAGFILLLGALLIAL